MPAVRISELPSVTVIDKISASIIVQAGVTKNASKGDFVKDQELSSHTQAIKNHGTVLSGTVTPACSVDCNAHVIDVGGAIVLATPSATLIAGQMVTGTIELLGGDVNAVTFDANYDWGAAGAPTLTAKSLIGFSRKFGDVKTAAWHIGGFS